MCIKNRVGEFEEDENDENVGGAGGATTNGNPKRLLRPQSTIVEAESNAYHGNKTALYGLKLYWQQFYGLLVKRFIYTKRRYILYLILSCMPLLQAILQQTIATNNSAPPSFDPLVISKDLYPNAIFYYHESSFDDFNTAYKGIVGDFGEMVTATNYSKFILDQANDTSKYRRNMILGADYFEQDLPINNNLQKFKIAKAYFNSVPLHALPMSINLLNNALLKMSNVEKTITGKFESSI